MSEKPFHPADSRVPEDAKNDFVHSPTTCALTDIPAIGPAAARLLEAAGIHTQYQLIAKFLSLKDSASVSPIEHVERFFIWYKSVVHGPGHNNRAGTVHCIVSKVQLKYPELNYNPSVYPSEGSEELTEEEQWAKERRDEEEEEYRRQHGGKK